MPAWYVYGVTGHDLADLGGLRGVDDQPVQLLGEGDLRVAASAASERVRALEHADPQDVLTAVTRHDEVLVALNREGTVLPVRFGTVLPDEDAVADLLADPHGRVAAALAHVHEAEEWVVAVTAPTDDSDDTDDTADEELSPGQAYFAKRRRADHSRRQRRAAVVTAARDLDDHLQDLARDMVPMELTDPEMVARGAYLVPRRARGAFLDHVERTTPGVVDVQGPLPPYRFTGAVA